MHLQALALLQVWRDELCTRCMIALLAAFLFVSYLFATATPL
jgi:hypothetical protein